MAGIFSKSNLPTRPGAYVNFAGAKAETNITNPSGVIAIPLTHAWGPANTPVVINSWSEFLATFGAGGTDTTVINSAKLAPDYTEGYLAVKQAFRGEDYQGRGGASQVIVYRMVPAAAVAASVAIQNTTPATGLTLTAKYKGTYGNRLKVSVFQNASDNTKNDLVIYDNVSTVELERYTHTKASVTALAATINANSDWVTASTAAGTVALAAISLQTFASGTDVAATATEYTAAMAALEPYRFSLFCAANLTDVSIVASVVAWASGLNSVGKRFLTVLGGGTSDDLTSAQTRSAAINSAGTNDPNFVTLGIGQYVDSELGILTTAQLAPRLAGIMANRGEQQNITFARLTGLDVYSAAPTQSQILAALASGIVTIARDSNVESPLRIEKGVTTYVLTSNVDKPYAIYSSPKYLRTMIALEMEMTEWAEGNIIGQVAVNDDSRNYVLNYMNTLLQTRQDLGIIQPGWEIGTDSSPAPTDQDEFVALSYSLTFGRSLEQILNTIVVG
jgi:hypothetical protein